MVALARRTLLHDWRRFLPATLAVAGTGALLLVQAGLLLGIFASASVSIRTSTADLWAGFPGTPTVELGHPIPQGAATRLQMDPDVVRVEALQWQDGEWRNSNSDNPLPIFISGIDPHRNALMFAKVISTDLRDRLRDPGAVIVDRADLDKLSAAVEQSAWINGRLVHLVGAVVGLRALGGVNVIASYATARYLTVDAARTDDVMFWVAKLRPEASIAEVLQRLNPEQPSAGYAVWSAQEFADRASSYWLFETGAGVGFAFLAAVIFFCGALIATQTLAAAVAGSIPEYATLRALGVAQRQLTRVVLEQSAWIGAAGLLLALLTASLAMPLARRLDVPAALSGRATLLCGALMMLLVLLTGLGASRALRRSDPAALLQQPQS